MIGIIVSFVVGAVSAIVATLLFSRKNKNIVSKVNTVVTTVAGK